ncbi:MAG: PmeII family type II restriction endonuclease [Paludibacter sp.]|nr:PmeII family type II restriction endonuclease [Paludibacter sp.]
MSTRKLNIQDVAQYVEKNIGTFHEKRIQSLDDLKLVKVLKTTVRYKKCILLAKTLSRLLSGAMKNC